MAMLCVFSILVFYRSLTGGCAAKMVFYGLRNDRNYSTPLLLNTPQLFGINMLWVVMHCAFVLFLLCGLEKGTL